MKAVSQIPGVSLKVVAPVPWFPPLKIFKKWYSFSQIPKFEIIDGIEVYHPRFLVTPKLGMSLYGFWMFLGGLRCIREIQKKFPFDLLDAHYSYPDGLAAILIGYKFKKPVVITARGSDVTLYRKLPLIKNLLRTTFKQANSMVAVSHSLGELMVAEGVDRKKLSIIPNGIDSHRFFYVDRLQARQKLGLKANGKILLTVCALVELKGIHILVEALHLLQQRGIKDFNAFIIGEGEMRPLLEGKIANYGLEAQVKLIGQVANENLPNWYNASDLFFLGSSREGWPNVVCEAQACGVPVVATNVNGIPEILDSDELGIMVERNPEAFAEGIQQALTKDWSRELIARKGQQRTWENVACEVHQLFASLVSNEAN